MLLGDDLLPLLVLMAGHAALHLYYIAAWTSQHGKHVVQMSTVTSMQQRFRVCGRREVMWFLLGTSYDIATHLLLLALLLRCRPACWPLAVMP